VGGGGSQPEQSMLVASFGGTKVWVFVFLRDSRTQSVGSAIILANRLGGRSTDGPTWSQSLPTRRERLLLLKKWFVVKRKQKTCPSNEDCV
jgi:hypothetical protein